MLQFHLWVKNRNFGGIVKKVLHSFLMMIFLGTATTSQAAVPKETEVYPVVVMGGGVGALTSSIYLQRAGINTVVIEGETPGGAIAQSPMVHNWPGEIEIEGQDLVDKIRNHAEVNGAKILSQEVISVDFSERPLKITTKDLYTQKTHTIYANSCIIATGATPKLLGIPGENDYWTKGVYSCAVCDGSLYKNKTVAVIGGGDSAVLEADYLSHIAKKVYLILRSDKFRAVEVLRRDQLLKKPNVEVLYNTQLLEIKGNKERVTHIIMKTPKNPKKHLDLDAVFVAIGARPNSQIFQDQLEIDKNGYILLKDGQATSIPGVFAVGDIVDPVVKQAVSAAGDGAKAALRVENYLATANLPKSQSSRKTPTIQGKPLRRVPKVKATSVSHSSGVKEISSKREFHRLIANKNQPVVVDFYSPYCGPCRKLSPEFDQVAEKYQGQINFVKVNTAKFSELAESYNVYGVPTVIIFEKGKESQRKTGLAGIRKMLDNLDSMAK